MNSLKAPVSAATIVVAPDVTWRSIAEYQVEPSEDGAFLLSICCLEPRVDATGRTSGSIVTTRPMTAARFDHVAVLLPTGRQHDGPAGRRSCRPSTNRRRIVCRRYSYDRGHVSKIQLASKLNFSRVVHAIDLSEIGSVCGALN